MGKKSTNVVESIRHIGPLLKVINTPVDPY